MTQPLDFAIVGAGASGIYTAWRLANATAAEVTSIRKQIGGSGPLRITVFEQSDRIGGRLLSVSPATLPDTPMELGGMRYLSNQPLVKGLVEDKLHVSHHPQDVDEPGNVSYLRRRMFRQADLHTPGVALPYDLTERELWEIKAPGVTTPAQLILWAVLQEFPEIDGMPSETLRSFLQTAEIDGKPLYQWGFWNLIARHLSNEGRQLALTTVGYDSLGSNANAVDIIAENFDFTPDVTYALFDEGFESVIWTLADEFRAMGGTIATGMTLEGFQTSAASSPPTYDLEFQKRAGADSPQGVTARAVVLALPQAALQTLRKIGPVFGPQAAEVPMLLNSVSSIPLYKLFLIYDRPWWQDQLGLNKGRSLTDLPVRQCYYWATNPGAPSAVMAYNDQDSASFWGGYQIGPLGPGDALQTPGVRAYLPDKAPAASDPSGEYEKQRRLNWEAHKAPHEMVLELHRQLMEMHGVADAPLPIDAAYMDWMNAPYGGAVHFWNPGYKSWEVLDKMIQPVAGVNAFIVGESYSTNQTWVEGALQTSELLLQGKLGLAKPAWVKEQKTLHPNGART
jgi:hypothetical protein